MRHFVCCAMLGMALSACEVVEPGETATVEQPGITLQGITLQGITLQGITLQGMNLLGFRVDGVTLWGDELDNVRVHRGEVIAKRGSTTLRGTALVGARFWAEARNLSTSPPSTALAEFRIAAIEPELSRYDPTDTGHTFLYTLEQRVADSSSWQPACPADSDGRRVAIPLTAIWDERGDRIESSSLFTFGCTTGVIAKCYRWGYRPWIDGYGDMPATHWACTRVARADYCGVGHSSTHEGTKINLWDNLSPQIQRHGFLPPLGMLFEAGWNTGGAVCLSRSRWLLDDTRLLVDLCPDRLVPPGLGETVCNTVGEVLGYDGNARLFNEASLLNL